MAQYRATIQGQRGAASRLGGKRSGISAYVNGWQCGVRVVSSDDSDRTGQDEFEVFSTSGSGHTPGGRCLGTIKVVNGRVTWIPVTEESNNG